MYSSPVRSRAACSAIRQKGLTEKNRGRLRALSDPMAQLRLLDLSEQLLRLAGRQRNPHKRALHAQIALAIEVLLHAPIRLSNLVSLRLDRHFSATRPGLRGLVHLVIPAEEVKNLQRLQFEVSSKVAQLLRLYVKEHLPVLSNGEPIWLFPGQVSGNKHPVSLGDQIGKAILKHAGLHMNVHLFRHFASMMYLREKPGAFALVARLLGHKSVQTTMDFYAEFDTAAAARHYEETCLAPRRGTTKGKRRP